MRLNKHLALTTGISRRAADRAIQEGRVQINGHSAELGQEVQPQDIVSLNGIDLKQATSLHTIMLNKPVGYVVSRDGQGNKTVYDLLPPELHNLKPVGRLDKHSSGLLLLTNDGDLAQELTHPSHQKLKRYKVRLDKDLSPKDFVHITRDGVRLEDGESRLQLEAINDQLMEWKVMMSEGRNRQIRRTFESLGYHVKKLHRTHFGNYVLGVLPLAKYKEL